MEYVYERKINYYETDRMGVVHHSNYIRYLEETRCGWMEALGIPMSLFEERGFTIPVLEVNCNERRHHHGRAEGRGVQRRPHDRFLHGPGPEDLPGRGRSVHEALLHHPGSAPGQSEKDRAGLS